MNVVTIQATDAAHAIQLVDADTDDGVLIANLDSQATLIVSPVRNCPTTQSFPLPPGKSVVWPGGQPAYAYATGAGTVTTPTALVSPGGGQMNPSASEIASQAAAGYRVIDYRVAEPNPVALDATGVATMRFGGVPANQFWQVVRAVESSSGNVMPTMRLYVVTTNAAVDQQHLVSGSANGLFDEADYPGDGLWVLGGQELVAQWTHGQANGGNCYCAVQYRLLQRG